MSGAVLYVFYVYVFSDIIFTSYGSLRPEMVLKYVMNVCFPKS